MDEEAVSLSCTIKPLPVALALESTSRCLRSPQAAKSCTRSPSLTYPPLPPALSVSRLYIYSHADAHGPSQLSQEYFGYFPPLYHNNSSVSSRSPPTPGYARVGVPPTPSPTVVRIAMLSASLSVPVPSPRGVFLGASQSSALLYVWTFSSINQDVTS